MEEEDIAGLSSPIEVAFSEVFQVTGMQNQTCSQKILQSMLKNLETRQLLKNSITDDFDKSLLKKIEKGLKQSKIKVFPDFGCSIVMLKKNSFEPTELYLVFPKQWDFNSLLHKDKTLYIPDSPHSSNGIQIGSIVHGCSSLSQQFNSFMKLVESIKIISNPEKQKKKNHHTPTWFLQIAKKALEVFNRGQAAQYIEEKKKKKQTQQKEIRILSKGGTLDVGQHTGITLPNTSFQIAKSLFLFFCLDTEIVQLLLLDYKLSLLSQSTFEISRIKEKELKKYFQCVISIGKDIKNLNSNRFKLYAQFCKARLKVIYQALTPFEATRSGQIIQPEELALSIHQSIREQNLQLYSVGSYDSNSIISSNRSGDLGFLKAIDGHLSCSQLLSSTLDKGFWIMQVQMFFFRLATKVLDQEIIYIPVNVQQLCCLQKNQFSKIHELVRKYQHFIIQQEQSKTYGMKLKNQSWCHVMLIKYIAAAVVFQAVKHKRKDLSSNLQKYRLQLKTDKLFSEFYSLSFQARRAIISLYRYEFRHKNKELFFVLQQSNKTFRSYAKIIADEDETMKQWKKSQEKCLQSQIYKLEKQFQGYGEQLRRLNRQKSEIYLKSCYCTYEKVRTYYGSYVDQKVTCSRCRQYQSAQSSLKYHEQKTTYQILSSYPQYQINLYAFLNNIPLDILGLMKIYYEAQISTVKPVNSIQNSVNLQNYFSNKQQYSPIGLYSREIKINKFSLLTNYLKPASNFVKYPQSSTYNYYFDIRDRQSLPSQEMSPQKIQSPQFQSIYQFMINSINSTDKQREHQIYSSKSSTRSIKDQHQFVELGSIRITQSTELMGLAEVIKNRLISIQTLISNSKKVQQSPNQQSFIKMLVLLNSAADLKAFKNFQKGEKNCQIFYHAQEALMQMIEKFMLKWQFKDLYSLHLIGVIFSLFSKELSKEKQVSAIAHACFHQYTKFSSENKTADNSLKSQLAFFLHGAMAFYTQDLTSTLEKDSIHTWVKIMLMYRVNKVFSDQNIKEPKFRQTMIYYEHYREKAIFNNVSHVKDYFEQKPQELTQLVKIIDNGIPQKTCWMYEKQKGEYVFKGTSPQATYEINLFTGIILKNGCQLTGLPLVVKNNQTYKTIFGVNRDLQVYPELDGSLRTRCSFQEFFYNQPKYCIFFQFKILQEDLLIRMIFKQKGTDEEIKYVLIDEKLLKDSNFILPQLYLQQYYGWYSQKKGHLIYRLKPLTQLYIIGLFQLVKLQPDQKILTISQSRIVQNKFRKEPIQFLADSKNSYYFSHLCLFNKQSLINSNFSSINKGFQILSSIEYPQYIIQIKCYSPSSNDNYQANIKFWLHRYNLNFTLCNEKGLLSDNFQGYAIDSQYRNHQLVPITKFHSVNCIVLKKIDQDLRFTKNHDFMLLVPDTYIDIKETINPILKGELVQMKMINYEIHNHFKDLRGKRRLDQLHLACILASCSIQNFEPLGMSNIEYAIHILRSCISIKPLNKQQLKKLQNLLEIAIAQRKQSLILQCQAVYTSTNLLKLVLPFDNRPKFERQNLIQSDKFLENQDLIENCKYQYRKHKNEGILPIREHLNHLQLEILRFTHYNSKDILFHKQFQKRKGEISQKKQKNLTELLKLGNHWLLQCIRTNKKILNHESKRQIREDIENQAQKLSISSQDACKIAKEQQEQIKDSLEAFISSQHQDSQILLDQQNIQRNKQYYQGKIVILKDIKSKLSQQIENAQSQIIPPLDLMMKQSSIVKERDFTSVICEQQTIYLLNSHITKSSAHLLKKSIALWLKLTVKIDSIERILQILIQPSPIDKISLKRQIQSPRQGIQSNLPWVCFEAEMKTQIWKTQFETYKLLIQSNAGTFTQLNMGQGKTQVIIPMMVLNELYNRKHFIPRVNILSPLYKQAQQNYYKFLSVTGFNVNIIAIYFNRGVEVNQQNINKMQYAMHLFRKKSLVLADRDSSLSMILKIREQYGFKANLAQDSKLNNLQQTCNKKDRWFFRNMPVFDIYDEVDALMTAKKSFVYAVGGAEALPSQLLRFQYSKQILQIVVKQMFAFLLENQIAILQQSFEHAQKRIKCGGFPKGIRFLSKLSQQKILTFRKKMVDIFLSPDYLPPEFQFYKDLSEKSKEQLKQYLINQAVSNQIISKTNSIPNKVLNQIFAVRGLLAYGIIQHCFSLRNGVDYGVPGSDNRKRVGVPYEAADVPSKRSQYSHPDVATALSFLAYYSKGLTFSQFQQALKSLLNQTKSSKEKHFKDWLNCIQNISARPKDIFEPKQINLQSLTQKKILYQSFKNCRSTISYWLICCVFPTDLTQYLKSITASSHDLANSKNSVGFTGTKDTRWTMPQYLSLKMSRNQQIKGTDGKMISLMLRNTLGVNQITINSNQLWKRFVENCLQLSVGCIIDAGAVLAGKSLENQIVPWMSNHSLFKKLNFRGILYCNQSGSWKVYDVSSHSTIDRDTSIPQHQTFVIYDEARTRGADIKMKTDTVAVLSLGPNMTKDKMMQAVGRLRKFGRNQKIFILGTKEIFNSIDKFDISSQSTQFKTKQIIDWVCQNSVKDNLKMLYPNMKLAWIHFENICSKREVEAQQFDPNLEVMYKDIIEYEKLQLINKKMAEKFMKDHSQNQQIFKLIQTIDNYGNGYKVRCQNLQDICQREIQMIEENEKEVQRELLIIHPVKQGEQIKASKEQISTLNIKLSKKLIFSQNFLKCTERKSGFYATENEKRGDNQLCKIHFVRIDPKNKQIMVITQQQADKLHKGGVEITGPYCINKSFTAPFVARFSDLTIETPCIGESNLQQALTDAQFFNGNENFENLDLLLTTVLNNLSIVKESEVDKIVCHFLERRGTLEDLYYSSGLEIVYKKVMNKL